MGDGRWEMGDVRCVMYDVDREEKICNFIATCKTLNYAMVISFARYTSWIMFSNSMPSFMGF